MVRIFTHLNVLREGTFIIGGGGGGGWSLRGEGHQSNLQAKGRVTSFT